MTRRKEEFWTPTPSGENEHLPSSQKGLFTREQLCRKSSFWEAYALNKFALIPRGGSIVILLPFWRIETGNLLLGIDVNHNLKSRWTFNEKSNLLSSEDLFSLWIYFIWINWFDKTLETGHPAWSKMTILKEDPLPTVHCSLDESFRSRSLDEDDVVATHKAFKLVTYLSLAQWNGW